MTQPRVRAGTCSVRLWIHTPRFPYEVNDGTVYLSASVGGPVPGCGRWNTASLAADGSDTEHTRKSQKCLPQLKRMPCLLAQWACS